MRVFNNLMAANKARQLLWNKGSTTNGALYANVELNGEVGECVEVALMLKALRMNNTVKKLEREARGLVGSRASIEDLKDEIGDVLICVNLLALEFGIDADRCAAQKFNKTSRKLGFDVYMDEGPTNAVS